MGESLVVIQNIQLAKKTLTVSSDIEPTGKLQLDEEGKATLNENAAKILSEIPGFVIVGKAPKDQKPQELKEPVIPASKVEDKNLDVNNGDIDEEASPTAIEPTGKDEAPITDQNSDELQFPEGEPNIKWKVPELIAWLNKLEPKPEFDPKAKKEVLLGIAFKRLEESKSKEENN